MKENKSEAEIRKSENDKEEMSWDGIQQSERKKMMQMEGFVSE